MTTATTRARRPNEQDGREHFFVSRDEFDAVKAMSIAAREENEALRARIEALESAANPAAAKPKAAPKPRKGAKS